MTQNEIRERLLDLARVRLKARFGAFEQFRLTLEGLPAGVAILARAGLMPAPWTVGLKMGLDTAAKQIDMHFLRLIDAWAQEQAPARQISALEGLQLLPVESSIEAAQPKATTQSPATPAPVGAASDGPAKPKRRTWQDIAMPYIVDTFKSGQYTTAKEFYRALEKKAGPDSPFNRGTGPNTDSLCVREISQNLTLKTVQNVVWPKLKTSR